MSKRRFWQIHLSTAVVLMFVTAGFLWLNFRPRHVQWFVLRWHEKYYFEPATVIGWPRVYSGHTNTGSTLDVPPLFVSVTINLTVMLVAVVIASFACEYFIRRRERGR